MKIKKLFIGSSLQTWTLLIIYWFKSSDLDPVNKSVDFKLKIDFSIAIRLEDIISTNVLQSEDCKE
jgi:hypothetical protein